MEVYQGKSVFGGIAIGRISVHKKDEQQVKRVKIENPDLRSLVTDRPDKPPWSSCGICTRKP